MFGIFLQAAKLYTSKQAHRVYVIVTHRERTALNAGSTIKEFAWVFFTNSSLFFFFCEMTIYSIIL